MKRYRIVAVCLILVYCSPDSQAKSPAAPAAAPPASSTVPVASDTGSNSADSSTKQAAAPGVSASACRHTGQWALCSVENRLRQAGFVARRLGGNAQRRPGFSVAPTVYSIARGRLEVFIYADETAMTRDIAKLDTVTVAPAGVASAWGGMPMLVRSGNLAAVFVTDNVRQAERLALALTAGAPQPGSPR